MKRTRRSLIEDMENNREIKTGRGWESATFNWKNLKNSEVEELYKISRRKKR